MHLLLFIQVCLPWAMSDDQDQACPFNSAAHPRKRKPIFHIDSIPPVPLFISASFLINTCTVVKNGISWRQQRDASVVYSWHLSTQKYQWLIHGRKSTLVTNCGWQQSLLTRLWFVDWHPLVIIRYLGPTDLPVLQDKGIQRLQYISLRFIAK